jgi:hypothetical protein
MNEANKGEIDLSIISAASWYLMDKVYSYQL